MEVVKIFQQLPTSADLRPWELIHSFKGRLQQKQNKTKHYRIPNNRNFDYSSMHL